MIGKRAQGRVNAALFERQIADLVAYIDRAGADQDRGEVVYQGADNFVSQTRGAQAAEMAATAMGAPKARSPVEHIVLSWRPGEYPDAREVDQAVAYVLKEAGLADHMALYTLHSAENLHLHIVICRVRPGSSRPTKVAFWHNATAASEATAAREGTDKIIELLTEGAGQVDPLAAIIDLLKLMNTKLDAILERLPSAPPQA